MKHYYVSVNITVSKDLYIEAESEAEAKSIVNGWMSYNPYSHLSNVRYVAHDITDVNEEEEEEYE